MARWLTGRGHECRVLLKQAEQYGITEIYEYQGVTVFPPLCGRRPGSPNIEIELFQWCEIAITHLEYTGFTIDMTRIIEKASKTKRPVFHVVHNDTPYDVVLCAMKPVNIIYNSDWIARKLNYYHRSMTLTPPVDYRIHDQGIDTEKNPYITLINCNDNKGGRVLGRIARAMPERQFLAVKGSYEEQLIDDLPNIRIVENTPNIKPIYAETRILIMPSKYESWGMTATEAMCNGIPVICTPTPGLIENTDGKMLYCARNDIAGWIRRIRFLDNPANYRKYSAAGRERSRELDPLIGYENLENFLYVAD